MDFTSFFGSSKVYARGTVGVEILLVIFVAVDVVVDVEAFVRTMVARGIASSEIITNYELYSFSFISLSIYACMSLIYAFCSIINMRISSFWLYVSPTSFACGFSVAGIFNFFQSAAMLVFLFLTIHSTSLILLRSYPILMTKSSKDFILLSFAKEETFSSFNWD